MLERKIENDIRSWLDTSKTALLEEYVHQKIMQHFQRYLVVGGMPAAVQEYVDSGDISKVTVIQRNIIDLSVMLHKEVSLNQDK